MIFFYSIVVPERNFVLLTVFEYPLRINLNGFFEALELAGRFLTMLLASMVVRANTTSEEFITGLTKLKMPEKFALVLDSILSSIEEHAKDKPKKQGQNRKRIVIKRILKGGFYVLIDMVNRRLSEAKSRFADSDLAVIFAFTLIIVSFRFIDVLPGFLVAPGYKNVVIIPFFIVGASITTLRFTATYIGFLAGIMHFMIGLGKFGVLGILQFMAPGLVVDAMIRLTRLSSSLFIYALVGIGAGLARVTALILLSIAFNVPAEFYLVLTPFFISQCVFGALSAPVTRYLLKHVQKG